MFEVRKKLKTSQQAARSNSHPAISFLSQKSSQLSAGTTSKWRQRRLNKKSNPASFVLSNSSDNSSFDSSRSDHPQQSVHKTITLALDHPNPATQEGNMAAADSNDCVIFTNVELVIETEETIM